MIDSIDEVMWRWAKELHSPDGARCSTSLGRLIDNQGVLIASTANLNEGISVDIELIVNKRLPVDLQRLAYVRYIEEIHPPWLELNMTRRTYFRRVSLLHAVVKDYLTGCRRGCPTSPTRST